MYAHRRSALPTTASASSSSPLLPTPTASEATGAGHAAQGGMNLRHTVSLLPTPAARDWKSGESNLIGTNARPLNEVVVNLLPTPTRADGECTSPTFGRGNPTLTGAVSPLRSTAGRPPSDDVPPGQLTLDVA